MSEVNKPKLNKQPNKQPMPTQDPQVRVKNFSEVALGYTEEDAVTEALRCMTCKKSPCRQGCPVEVDIPAFISRIKERDFEGAIAKIKEKNNLPAICGRVCPRKPSVKSTAWLAKRMNRWPLVVWKDSLPIMKWPMATARHRHLLRRPARRWPLSGQAPPG